TVSLKSTSTSLSQLSVAVRVTGAVIFAQFTVISAGNVPENTGAVVSVYVNVAVVSIVWLQASVAAKVTIMLFELPQFISQLLLLKLLVHVTSQLPDTDAFPLLFNQFKNSLSALSIPHSTVKSLASFSKIRSPGASTLKVALQLFVIPQSSVTE